VCMSHSPRLVMLGCIVLNLQPENITSEAAQGFIYVLDIINKVYIVIYVEYCSSLYLEMYLFLSPFVQYLIFIV